MRTDSDVGALASVRAALSGGDLAVTDLQDRWRQLLELKRDPLQLDLIGALGLGAATALLLALIGVWTGSALNARGRLTSFAVLRALGTTPRQILTMLIWEQGVVYVLALGLGLLLGLLLSTAALPALIFTSLLANLGANDGPPIDVPAAQVIVRGDWLGITMGALVVICALAVAITTFIVSRASLSESLRLNQD